MCILSYIPGGIEADDRVVTDLWNGGVQNGDGHGWAIVTNAGVIMRRTLSLDEAIESFAEARERRPEGDALFHSRWATHGSVRTGLCHPFLVGDDHRTVLAHNGVIRAATPTKGDDRSDTQIFASEIVPKRFRRLDRPGVQAALAAYIGTTNKVLILTSNPRYEQTAYLFGESRGEWDSETGIWHSNGDYRWSRYPATSNAATTVVGSGSRFDYGDRGDTNDDYGDDSCVFCLGRINTIGLCVSCGTCADCYEPSLSCLCFVSKSAAFAAMNK